MAGFKQSQIQIDYLNLNGKELYINDILFMGKANMLLEDRYKGIVQ